ncbi:MAG: AEC family transporter [Candidatus Omnitrophica bacterium]|nr:AEC family transporter [Candidatus Omnitrophota bacterium]
MSTLSFQTSAIAITQIFAMGAVGYFLVRRKVMNEDGLKLLAFLTVNILFPLFIFVQIILHFDPSRMPFWWGYPLINMALIAAGMAATAIVFGFSRRRPPDEFLAASSLHNAGFIPLLMAMALPLGAAAGKVYAAVIMSIIGFDLCLWSLGVWLLTRRDRPRMELKNMFNPPLLSMLAAIIIVLAGGQGFFTETLLKPVGIMGDSAMGIAMLTIGGNLAMTDFIRIRPRPVTGVVLIKLVLVPMFALTALLFLRLGPIMSFVVMLQACMPTSVTLSIIGRHYGTKNQEFINQGIFFTHLLCVVTLPVFLGLYGKWVH